MTEYKVDQLTEDPSYIGHEIPIMERWKNENNYDKITTTKMGNPLFRFKDGPPFPSSQYLHMGHLLVGFVKDAVLRYKYMTGYDCLNKIGYDCHGLPLESVAYKLLGINSHKEVIEMGIDKYNDYCKGIVKKFSGAWNPIFDRIARQVNLNDTYRTMDCDFMESVWWIFKELWNKNLVYRGYEVMPYSVKCGTPLSNFEASDKYKVIDTESIYVRFPLVNDPSTSLVAWTTTPWTLPSNVSLCVNPDATYVKLIDEKGYGYIVAEKLVDECKIKHVKSEKIGTGKDLVGIEYVPPFSYLKRDKYIVISGDFVMVDHSKSYKNKKEDDEDDEEFVKDTCIGTGIVHLAPNYGQDDLKVCLENGIISLEEVEEICSIDADGNYTDLISDFSGLNVLDADRKIIDDIKKKHLVLRVYKYKHKYPHCYRTETPLIYKAVSCFFVKVTELRDKLVKNNDKATFVPSYVGERRFKNWLENAKDWCISRFRYFGTPIPIWATEDESEMECIGSIQELLERARELPENSHLDLSKLDDIHREFVDSIKLRSKSGKLMTRSTHVFDCWFESGAVPMAQYHYPFANREKVEDCEYLADFIAEGLDQTRGWFYTLMVLSTALFDKPAFKNVICTGMILDENGIKYSKKNGNFKNPMELLDKYGADTLRLYLLSSSCVRAEPLLFNEQHIDKVRHKIIPYINAVKFFLEHFINFLKNGGKFDLDMYKLSDNVTDKWIISRVATLLDTVHSKFEGYHIDTIVKSCLDFVEDLTNWYVKFNRDRLKGLSSQDDYAMSLSTLFKVLMTYCKIMAPFTPYLSEHIYDQLKNLLPEKEREQSIHMCLYPRKDDLEQNTEVEVKFLRLQQVVKNIRKLRSMSVKFSSVKIPIKTVTIIHSDPNFMSHIQSFEEFIMDEVNCLNFEYKKPDGFLKYTVTFNNKSMGKKYKSQATQIKEQLLNVSNIFLESFANRETDSINVNVDGNFYDLTREDFDVVPELKVDPLSLYVSEGPLTIMIDTTYDEETHYLFQIRRFINYVQNMRKTYSLRPWDKISVYVVTDNDMIINLFKKYEDRIFDRLKSKVITLDQLGSKLNNTRFSKLFDWSLGSESDECLFIPVVIEKLQNKTEMEC